VVGHAEHHEPPIPIIAITGIIVGTVAIGVGLAIWLFTRRDIPTTAPQDVSWVTRAARKDLYGDDINESLVVQPGRRMVDASLATDRQVIDGSVNGTGTLIGGLGLALRKAQTGYVRSYALSVLGGALLLVLILVVVNL
jgi:NADH-quinone oxidoreductase subunit L